MATDAEIEAAKIAVRDEYGSHLCLWRADGKRTCRIEEGLQCMCQNIAAAALDAAASVRAEAGTEGMEILRLVAAIPLWRDHFPDATLDAFNVRTATATGLTPDHVRAARAIVATAEPTPELRRVHAAYLDNERRRKEVVSSGQAPQHHVDTAPPTAGPSPPAGAYGWRPIETAPRDGTYVLIACDTEVYKARYDDRADFWYFEVDGCCENPDHWQPLPSPPAATSPHPPAPAQGAPDDRLIEYLRAAHAAWLAGPYPEGAGLLFRQAADALTAQAAEIELIKTARWTPVGDNHHNAALCPYCNPQLQTQAAALSAKEAECEHGMALVAESLARAEQAEAECERLREALHYVDDWGGLSLDQKKYIRSALSGKEATR